MRSAYKQVVTNQPGDIRRERAIAQLFPTHVHKPPNFEGECDALGHGAQCRQRQIVPTGRRDALKTVNAINQLHQQPLAWLAGSIARDEFPINSIMCRLCVARNLEGDEMFRI